MGQGLAETRRRFEGVAGAVPGRDLNLADGDTLAERAGET